MIAFQIYVLTDCLKHRREIQKDCFMIEQSLLSLKEDAPDEFFRNSMRSMALDPRFKATSGLYERTAKTGQVPTSDELFQALASASLKMPQIYVQCGFLVLFIALYTVLTWLRIKRAELADQREYFRTSRGPAAESRAPSA
jgi:hypothetical protein